MKANFASTLIKQLHDQELGIDAQLTLVSLCKHGELLRLSSSPQINSLKIRNVDDCRNEIVKLGFVEILVDRLAKDKYFDDAQHGLEALIKHRKYLGYASARAD